jgi:TM2 domain-containing membrane protein YozV
MGLIKSYKILIISVFLIIIRYSSGDGVSAQSAKPDWGFIRFLIDQENYTQVLTALGTDTVETGATADSLSFYRGWALYNLKKLPAATDAFRSVSAASTLHTRAGLLGAWNLAYGKDLGGADSWLHALHGNSADEESLLKFETLGLKLLQRDLAGFGQLRGDFTASHYAWGEALGRIDDYQAQLLAYRPKKMAMAGVLSALVPGLGKIYAGQTGSGISSFLLCGALAAVTVENGIKTGWGNWSTILFGSLFTLFYAGNIYGTLAATREIRDYYHEDMDQRILLDMHLPVREFYR